MTPTYTTTTTERTVGSDPDTLPGQVPLAEWGSEDVLSPTNALTERRNLKTFIDRTTTGEEIRPEVTTYQTTEERISSETRPDRSTYETTPPVTTYERTQGTMVREVVPERVET